MGPSLRKYHRIYGREHLNIENDPGHPTLISLLQAELVQCDSFHIHPLLMAVWVKRFTLGQGCQPVVAVFFLQPDLPNP